MTRTELTAILGSRMIRSTNHPGVAELRPGSFFGRSEDRERLEPDDQRSHRHTLQSFLLSA